jgi:hypothetical protein
MTTDFGRALDEALASETLSLPVLAALSSPSLEEVERFAERLGTIEGTAKHKLLAAMVRLAEASFEIDYVDLFRRFLTDPDPVVRRHAVEGLWEDERPGLVRPLLRMLRTDADVGVRSAVATSMGRFLFLAICEELDERIGQTIEAALRSTIESPHEDPEVRRRAIESAAFLSEDWVQQQIGRAYDDDDPRMRQSALFAMGRNADQVWAEVVLTELGNPSAALRYEAARASGEMGLKQAVTPLIQMLTDPDAEVQGMAVWALGQIGGRQARTALEYCASSDNEALCEAASAALDEIEFSDQPLDLFVYDPSRARLGVESDGETPDEETDDRLAADYVSVDDWDPEHPGDDEDDDDWDDDVIDLE